MATAYELSWRKTSLLAKMELLLGSEAAAARIKTRSKDPTTRADGYSALSSTHFSIAGTAAAQLKQWRRPWWLLLLLPMRLLAWSILGGYCYLRMKPLSDAALENAGGYAGMTAAQCDVRQNILRKWRMWDEAEECINAVLA